MYFDCHHFCVILRLSSIFQNWRTTLNFVDQFYKLNFISRQKREKNGSQKINSAPRLCRPGQKYVEDLFSHMFLFHFVITSYLICIMTSFSKTCQLSISQGRVRSFFSHGFHFVIPSYLICIMTSFRKKCQLSISQGRVRSFFSHVFHFVITSYLICILTSFRKKCQLSISQGRVRSFFLTCFSFRHYLLFDMHNDFFQKKVSTLYRSGTCTHVFHFVIPSYLICIMTSFRKKCQLSTSQGRVHMFFISSLPLIWYA